MTADQLLNLLQNDWLNVAVRNGRIYLTPPHIVTPRHRELVKKHREALAALLAKYPGHRVEARDRESYQPRADEIARSYVRRPQVMTRRRR